MDQNNKELMELFSGAPARPTYPRVAWENPSRGLRAVEFFDEEECKVCVGMEVRAGYDLMGKPIWRHANTCNERDMEVVLRSVLRDLSPHEPSFLRGRFDF